MSTVKKQNDKNRKLYEKYTVRHALVNYYLLLMFTIFPLFATNAYFNIRHDKYYFFIILSALIFFSEVALIISVRSEQKKNAPPDMSVTDKVWYKTFSFTDWAMIALLVTSFISTLLSEFPLDSLLGTAGRNNGLLLTAIYVGIYFLITRYFYFMEYVFMAMAVGSALVYLLAILNCYYIDPLGMFSLLTDEKTIIDFTSTIGNKNLLSSFICITLPVIIALSVHTKNKWFRLTYLVVSGLGFASLMTADSDSGILGVGVFLIIYFIWYSRRISRLKKYFLCITSMLLAGKLLRLFALIMNDNSKGLDNFQEFFVYENLSYVLLIGFAVITALLYLLDYKKPNIVLTKAVPITLGIIVGAGVIAVICAVIYFSFIDTTTQLGGIERFLRIDDKWGTHRGFMWIRSMWIFNDFSFIEKLFGCGPDTFYYAFQPYFQDLTKYGDASTNAAHNEYINYLITIGITGLASYLAVVGGSIARAIKASLKNPLAIVCVAAVICYSVQAVVNITQPITTPLFFIFIALCEAVARNTKLKNKNSFVTD